MKSRSAHLTVTHFGGQSRARSVRVEETLLATRTRVKRPNRVRREHSNISSKGGSNNLREVQTCRFS